MTYSEKYMLYFIVSFDYKLHVFNEFLNSCGLIPIATRLITHMSFCDDESLLVTAGVDGCYIYPFKIIERITPSGEYKPT